MKKFTKLNQFKASNVMYDIGTKRAYSYGWWRFVDVVDGVRIFNTHSYSVSTVKHQSKVKALLHNLGLSIDVYVDSRSGLQSNNWKVEAVDSINYEISEIQDKLNNKRRHKRLDAERMQSLGQLKEQKVKLLKLLDSMN